MQASSGTRYVAQTTCCKALCVCSCFCSRLVNDMPSTLGSVGHPTCTTQGTRGASNMSSSISSIGLLDNIAARQSEESEATVRHIHTTCILSMYNSIRLPAYDHRHHSFAGHHPGSSMVMRCEAQGRVGKHKAHSFVVHTAELDSALTLYQCSMVGLNLQNHSIGISRIM